MEAWFDYDINSDWANSLSFIEEDEERVLPPVIVPGTRPAGSGGLPFIDFGGFDAFIPVLPVPVLSPLDLPVLPGLADCLEDILDYLNGADFPDNVDMRQMRDVAEDISSNLINLSNSQLPELGNPFVEFGAFLIRGPDGAITTSDPFTELSSDSINLTSGQALEALLSVGPGSTIVGIIHTHSVSGLPSADDFSAVSNLIAALSGAGLDIAVDQDAVLYIVGPDGETREYARGSNGGDTDRLGVAIDENGNFEFTCETA